MDKIIIEKTRNADNRGGKDPIKQEILLKETEMHIEHVKAAAQFFAKLFLDKVEKHDHTKIEYIDMFYKDFIADRTEKRKFKDGFFWACHKSQEFHHLGKDGLVHSDITLADIDESAIDYAMSAAARGNGEADFEKFPIDIDYETFKLAYKNTINLLLYNTTIAKDDE